MKGFNIEPNFKLLQVDDINSVFIFNHDGKIIYLNKSAQMMSDINLSKKLFALAMNYASKDYGTKINYTDIYYGGDSFYGFKVTYENEEYIYLTLYKKIQPATTTCNKQFLGYHKIDFNMLLSINLELNNKNPNVSITTDYDIPPFYIHQNNFCMLMKEIFASLQHSKHINIIVKLKMGKMIIIKNKKYYIVCLNIHFDTHNSINFNNYKINTLSDRSLISLSMDENIISFEIPCIDNIANTITNKKTRSSAM